MVDRRITIIAECGINHNGSLPRARQMIAAAKECGADVAKFQVYAPKVILDPEHPLLKRWWTHILATELSYDEVAILKTQCDRHKIEFLASVFEPEKVAWLEAVDVERYKVAARSIYNEPLLRAVGATGKPVLVSLSEQYLHDVMPPFKAWGLTDIKKLFCISKYPTPIDEVHLTPGLFRYHDGFSDHTEGITASVAAMALGARIIEKHFTLDRRLPGPDQVCSIEPDELKLLCDIRDDMEAILGQRGHY